MGAPLLEATVAHAADGSQAVTQIRIAAIAAFPAFVVSPPPPPPPRCRRCQSQTIHTAELLSPSAGMCWCESHWRCRVRPAYEDLSGNCHARRPCRPKFARLPPALQRCRLRPAGVGSLEIPSPMPAAATAVKAAAEALAAAAAAAAKRRMMPSRTSTRSRAPRRRRVLLLLLLLQSMQAEDAGAATAAASQGASRAASSPARRALLSRPPTSCEWGCWRGPRSSTRCVRSVCGERGVWRECQDGGVWVSCAAACDATTHAALHYPHWPCPHPPPPCLRSTLWWTPWGGAATARSSSASTRGTTASTPSKWSAPSWCGGGEGCITLVALAALE